MADKCAYRFCSTGLTAKVSVAQGRDQTISFCTGFHAQLHFKGQRPENDEYVWDPSFPWFTWPDPMRTLVPTRNAVNPIKAKDSGTAQMEAE
eukprot:TRINITY_DN15842_c0_g1_i1.p1 TRINITY_DN15842_c0_g1~~TRINITY_DN15842_c0_g1_i1.p1  ORF type:complete len:108 (-),score=8.02 TRINITY_DN15842_c0_g1_i1:192-467(-)